MFIKKSFPVQGYGLFCYHSFTSFSQELCEVDSFYTHCINEAAEAWRSPNSLKQQTAQGGFWPHSSLRNPSRLPVGCRRGAVDRGECSNATRQCRLPAWLCSPSAQDAWSYGENFDPSGGEWASKLLWGRPITDRWPCSRGRNVAAFYIQSMTKIRH